MTGESAHGNVIFRLDYGSLSHFLCSDFMLACSDISFFTWCNPFSLSDQCKSVGSPGLMALEFSSDLLYKQVTVTVRVVALGILPFLDDHDPKEPQNEQSGQTYLAGEHKGPGGWGVGGGVGGGGGGGERESKERSILSHSYYIVISSLKQILSKFQNQ